MTPPLRLLVVSHAAVTPVNQDLFARLEAQHGWQIEIVLPRRWKTEYGVRSAARWPAFRGPLRPLPVAMNGNIPLHFYLHPLGRVVRRAQPDVVYVHHEPYALATAQVLRAAGRADLTFGVYGAQNLSKHFPWPVSRWERRVHARADFASP